MSSRRLFLRPRPPNCRIGGWSEGEGRLKCFLSADSSRGGGWAARTSVGRALIPNEEFFVTQSATTGRLAYKVKDISLAPQGREMIRMAAEDMPGLMTLQIGSG